MEAQSRNRLIWRGMLFTLNSIRGRCRRAVVRAAAASCAARSDLPAPAQMATSPPVDLASQAVGARPSTQYRNLRAARARQHRAATTPTSKSAREEYDCIAESLHN